MTDAEPAERIERDTSASVLAALAGSSAIAALLVTAGMWAAFAWTLLWLIWLVTLMMATVVGMPLYLAAAAMGRVNAWTAAGGGLAAGAALPLLFLLPGSETSSSILVGAIIAFSACGAVAGLVFLLILRWPRLNRSRRAAIGGAAAVLGVIAFAGAWVAQDHSCHNPVWYGQGIAPSASFRIAVPEAEWRDIASEVERFGRKNEWSVRTEAAFEAQRPWFRMSVCRPDGTVIQLSHGSGGGAFDAYVYQPQGGDGWMEPMRAFHAQVRARWPQAIGYLDSLGEPTARPADWMAPRAPPAARSAPSPAPPGPRP